MNSRRAFLKQCGRFGLGIAMIPVITSLQGCENIGGSSVFIVDNAKCTGCGDCINSCHQDAISLIDSKAEIDPNGCIGCGKCVDYCDYSAIA